MLKTIPLNVVFLFVMGLVISHKASSEAEVTKITREQIEAHDQLLVQDVLAILKMQLPMPLGKETYQNIKSQISKSKAFIDSESAGKIVVKFEVDTFDNGDSTQYLLEYHFENGFYKNGPVVIKRK